LLIEHFDAVAANDFVDELAHMGMLQNWVGFSRYFAGFWLESGGYDILLWRLHCELEWL
jgi:hypothetical protein